ncbi:nucleoside hydrolase [Cellulomonas hominis]
MTTGSAAGVPTTSAATGCATPRWTLGTVPWATRPPLGVARTRVIIDNDFSGDPDDLYQVVHHLLSPSVDIRAVVASHLAPGDPFDPSPTTATNAEKVLHELFDLLGLESHEVIVRGAEDALVDASTPRDTPAARAIIAEAHRADPRPLYVVAGGGLTEIASAYLLDPTIADKLTLIWIGGEEHDGLAFAPPDAMEVEYNLNIDLIAGQVVFGDSGLTIWQVPRDVYRQCLVSDIELQARVASQGAVGAYLYDALRPVAARAAAGRTPAGETYALGDSPLVLLTALQAFFEPDPSSSDYVLRPTPHLDDAGSYVADPGGRPMRVYTRIDTRLMFEDLFLKLQAFATWQKAH